MDIETTKTKFNRERVKPYYRTDYVQTFKRISALKYF